MAAVAQPGAKAGPVRKPSNRGMRAVTPPQATPKAAPPAAAAPVAPVQKPAPAPAPAPVAPQAPRPSPPRPSPVETAPQAGDLPEKRLRQIYAQYVEARRAANESTAGVTYEKLAESLRSQAAKLRETHQAKTVDYDVVVKNGKTMLKPVLR
jgi:hypothetical protein